MTTRYRKLYWLLFITSFLLNICPITVYTIKAVVESDLVHEKVALTMTVFIVLILTLVSFINKVALRSRLWIILIGIYTCINNILTPLIVIACCQILDELVVTPLKKSFKERLVINKQIDRRI